MTELKTRDDLLIKIAAAASKSQSAEEISRQKISFIMGSLGENSTVTLAQVRDVLAKQEGTRSAA